VSDPHDPGQLAAHAAGLLDEAGARTMDAHVAGCPHCQRELTELREVSAALRGLPPEWFLDGPPEDGELVLQRTLRQLRQERTRPGRRALVAAAVAALVVGVGAAGVSLGRVSASGPSAAAGSRVLTGTNASTGAHMTVTITPKGEWVRLSAATSGLPLGEHCVLVVVDRGGHPHIAGSWFAPRSAAEKAVTYTDDTAVAVPAADISAVELHGASGRDLVDVRA
jgi:hypothetical protein